MKKTILSLAVLIPLAGCAQYQTQAIMFNPETKHTAQCKADPDMDFLDPEGAVNHCVAGYEKAGYVRMDDPPANIDNKGE